ncbi:ABC transporter permease [Steroidobacter agaridevorans]|uniref:ABC transporter permease n=1 Tax=Steroidobacter agaridevorans TaxID=2695856 RepID=A0A829Y9K1_9GAMM|nr:FtsX-like permease family protein [Steroidobacter agaridevorans]GFE79673.1 ABC transporter permease [Steroidobacter agaridevorans]
MLRNFLAAALRNLKRNRFYAMVSVACIAVGLAATFLAVAYLDHLHSYNRWIAGYRQVYGISLSYTLPGLAPLDLETTPLDIASWAEANVHGVIETARIAKRRPVVRHGDVEGFEEIGWADSSLFRVLPMPAYSGDLQHALDRPDSVVLTRTLARKYFGTEDAVGKTLEIDRKHPMVVRAVLEDLPPNTRITGDGAVGMFGAASAAYSPMSLARGEWSTFSFLHVEPAVTKEQLDAGLSRYSLKGSSVKVQLRAVPLDRLVYSRDRQAVVYAMPLLAGLVLMISCMNFVNLTTARSIHRSTEVGVRKAAGAGRGALVAQFMGEALILSAVGMLIALSLCELALPVARTLLDAPMTFEYWRNPTLIAAIVAITVLTALLSGFYPAVLLSRLNPASILNGGRSRTGQSRGLRQALVIFQFAMLASLVVSVIVAGQQIDHLLKMTQRFDGEHMLLIHHASCRRAFLDELRTLPGVAGAACSQSAPINVVTNNAAAKRADGTRRSFEVVRIDAGFLELFGFRPLAGRFFRADQPADITAPESTAVKRVVISATAVREFGFESAEAAIGREPFPGSGTPMEIIGVVDDFRIGRFAEPMYSTVYVAEPSRTQLLCVRLEGEHLPETLDRIDELWLRLGDPRPINRQFLSESIEFMHRSIVRQRWIFSAFAVLAVSLAIVGLLGLASSAAEERRLEIGVRKAFGAGTSAIVRLILWQFTKLAAAAGVIGCLIALPLMRRWLEGFEDRIELQPWMFAGACVLILGVAVATVLGHSLLMARARPITALRNE